MSNVCLKSKKYFKMKFNIWKVNKTCFAFFIRILSTFFWFLITHIYWSEFQIIKQFLTVKKSINNKVFTFKKNQKKTLKNGMIIVRLIYKLRVWLKIHSNFANLFKISRHGIWCLLRLNFFYYYSYVIFIKFKIQFKILY